jgi:hypothetical protein
MLPAEFCTAAWANVTETGLFMKLLYLLDQQSTDAEIRGLKQHINQ